MKIYGDCVVDLLTLIWDERKRTDCETNLLASSAAKIWDFSLFLDGILNLTFFGAFPSKLRREINKQCHQLLSFFCILDLGWPMTTSPFVQSLDFYDSGYFGTLYNWGWKKKINCGSNLSEVTYLSPFSATECLEYYWHLTPIFGNEGIPSFRCSEVRRRR